MKGNRFFCSKNVISLYQVIIHIVRSDIVKKMRKGIRMLSAVVLTATILTGCSRPAKEEDNGRVLSDNIIITETGEVIQKDSAPTKEPADSGNREAEVQEQANAEMNTEIEIITPEIELTEPEQEQVITEEDQTEPTGSGLQIVFLGDSIFDNNRDGTGIPYLTAVQCEADVYNLAIGGTSASIESDEKMNDEDWSSRSLVGIVKAMMGAIPTDVFAGTRTKELLDNTSIDWSTTDYFVVEYGINDFFRAAPLSNPDDSFDLRTYAGALRYAAINLRNIAPDATVILCSPNYAQFFDGNWMIGDGNSVNTGYGTLFDYKGTCQYVAKEHQTNFFDAYIDLGINGYTAEEYLEDGVHLTQEGRQLYADALAEMILKYEETKNN